ncbi:MAG: 2-oxoglutarate dehydrogenase, E2 component, dihydrolipoamide succinyltransferase [Micrococcales bacterium]|nr:2-oxoglutarate dehydrogenase, E2 component, dihydrolipoamide succinyltransferase [Micrococcales bacterium]
MSHHVQLPALGESVTEGTVTQWLKAVGDRVEVDEPLLEISTDKVDTEIPSPVSGVLEQILVPEDETAEVGAVLAVIGDGTGTSAPAPAAPAETPATFEPPAAFEAPAATEPQSTPPAAFVDAPAATSGDATDVTLPALGESVTEGTVTRWLKAVGEHVDVDEPLLEISTDKVDTEMPSPVAGTLLEIVVPEDETAEVGAVLARIGSGAPAAVSTTPPAASAPAAPSVPPPPVVPAPTVPKPPSSAAPPSAALSVVPAPPFVPPAPSPAPVAIPPTPSQVTSTGYVTPLVRRLATERGVDLSRVVGTGVGGRIRKEDVLAAAAPLAATAPAGPTGVSAAPTTIGAVSPLRGTTEKASRLRQIIAERMVEALHTQAQLTTVVEVDVTKVAALRDRVKDEIARREGVRLTFLPFFVLAAGEALRTYPKVNGLLEGTQITYPASENIGIAVDTERGLVVPVLRDAVDLGLVGIARGIADLASRTRDNKVAPDELSGATFTVTNTGWGGALIDTPIVPTGTSAILATGAIVRRPAVVTAPDGSEAVAIRSMCYLALSYDHRLVDGADAARYLGAVKARIEEGSFEPDLGV